jgi:hypothetical protein
MRASYALFMAGILLTCAPPAEAKISYDIRLELWGAVSRLGIVDSPVNPGNQVALVPNTIFTGEARPDMRFGWKKLKLTLRPRMVTTDSVVPVLGTTSSKQLATLRWSEAFMSFAATDKVTVTYGLQNFQWGPAESISPSNRVFRDTVQAKDVLYLVKGKNIARVNFTPAQNWSEVLLAEVANSGGPQDAARETFAHKALLKSEVSWAGGANYVGQVTGWRERSGSWLGEYITVDPLEGLSLYGDASHQRGSIAYYPEDSNGATLLTQSHQSDQKVYTFAVGGARYAFVNGTDWRVEYIYQENGYNRSQVQSAWTSLASPIPQQRQYLEANAEFAYQNGLEFPGRQYLFSSLRFANFVNVSNWTVYLRDLYSLQDKSNSVFLSSENAVGKRGTFFLSGTASAGAVDSELRGLVAYVGTIGYRHAW